MASVSVRNWLGTAGQMALPALPPLPPLPSRPAEPAPQREAYWSETRLALLEDLFGSGFLMPGGAEEALRLVRPISLAAGANLLLVGAGVDGPGRAIATRLGVWVSGREAVPALAAGAAGRSDRTGPARRSQVEPWDPHAPALGRAEFHHALALMPLGQGQAEPVLAAITTGLRPNGQLVLIDFVADAPLDRADPEVAAFLRLERRSAEVPSETEITRMLGRLGFQLRLTEDLSDTHVRLAVYDWRRVINGMEARPSALEAALLVDEAERWVVRSRLMRAGKLRLMRWHGVLWSGAVEEPRLDRSGVPA